MPVLAVNDAWRLVPHAEILYACDASWWRFHKGCRGYGGERWSTHGGPRRDCKLTEAQQYALRLVAGADGDGFSQNPELLHYGGNSGFQAVGLAILMGARRIALAGFDMRGGHWFGKHPPGLRNTTSYIGFIRAFERAALALPPEVQIVNCTPGSALRCFPFGSLDDEIRACLAAVSGGGPAAGVSAADRFGARQRPLRG